MRIIAKKNLVEYWENHSGSETPLLTWYRTAQKAEWHTPNDVKRDYPSASIIKGNRMVFNIKGNDYRLIVAINYETQIIYIRFVGTHSEYDKIDASII